MEYHGVSWWSNETAADTSGCEAKKRKSLRGLAVPGLFRELQGKARCLADVSHMQYAYSDYAY
jgi:hypothetical protein